MPAAARITPPIEGAVLAAAAKKAALAASADVEPARAIESAVSVLWETLGGVFVSVFVLEHERLWVVAQRGYSVVPDGITITSGVTGRAVRSRRSQLVSDVSVDPDYVSAIPAVRSELAVPLRAGGAVVGVLNIESERALPEHAARLMRPLPTTLAPLAEALRTSSTIDLAGLTRLFVYLGSLRDADEIASLAAASLAKVLPIEASQIVLWDELGAPAELASWQLGGSERLPLSKAEIEGARALADPTAVCQVMQAGLRRGLRSVGSVVWLPLRTNGHEFGALVGLSVDDQLIETYRLDIASLLAAHVAASLDAALLLRRERQSAATDSLTGILNRRGFEEQLERALAEAQDRRMPLSLIIIDCDDFKEINDRAGHAFGDALLVEIADVLGGSLPEGAVAARLGGDEFVVMLPDAGADVAEAFGSRLRKVLAEGLTEAGFPLRISAGISTYPFDGAGATTLLRAADQALYAAKSQGKDCVASFRQIVRPSTSASSQVPAQTARERRGSGRGDGSVLSEVVEATRAMDAEDTVEGVCDRLCKALVFVVGATGCLASRVAGDYIVDTSQHSLRDVSLGAEAAYRIADFPLTAETLRTGRERSLSFLDDDVDPVEAFVLRELSMNAVLMIPVRVGGRPWGLVELYEMRLRRFTEDDVAIARFLVEHAERRLEIVDSERSARKRPRVYEVPSDRDKPSGRRVR